ncbi:Six-hairpin glycosidase-like protein, partial [Mycena sanguinolenta]
DLLLKAFAQTLRVFWSQLVRGTLCDGVKCASTLIQLNHTLVVTGGRFCEQYYWDLFWIVEELLGSQLYSVAKGTLQNFMDEIELFGFIPNGGRTYYLNHPQSLLFIQMLARYVAVTNDTSILTCALPLAERELDFWQNIPTMNVTSLFMKMHENTAPRPESYLDDYATIHDPAQPVLNATAEANLYVELVSGAETGWDYSSRWL